MEQNGLTERPRCKVCGRRLRSTPWKYLGIGPVCSRKNRVLAWALRDEYARRKTDEAAVLSVDQQAATTREIEALDAELRRFAILQTSPLS